MENAFLLKSIPHVWDQILSYLDWPALWTLAKAHNLTKDKVLDYFMRKDTDFADIPGLFMMAGNPQYPSSVGDAMTIEDEFESGPYNKLHVFAGEIELVAGNGHDGDDQKNTETKCCRVNRSRQSARTLEHGRYLCTICMICGKTTLSRDKTIVMEYQLPRTNINYNRCKVLASDELFYAFCGPSGVILDPRRRIKVEFEVSDTHLIDIVANKRYGVVMVNAPGKMFVLDRARGCEIIMTLGLDKMYASVILLKRSILIVQTGYSKYSDRLQADCGLIELDLPHLRPYKIPFAPGRSYRLPEDIGYVGLAMDGSGNLTLQKHGCDSPAKTKESLTDFFFKYC